VRQKQSRQEQLPTTHSRE